MSGAQPGFHAEGWGDRVAALVVDAVYLEMSTLVVLAIVVTGIGSHCSLSSIALSRDRRERRAARRDGCDDARSEATTDQAGGR